MGSASKASEVKSPTTKMLSTRNVSQGFAKYLSPKFVNVSSQKVVIPAVAETEKVVKFPKSSYRLSNSFGPTINIAAVTPAVLGRHSNVSATPMQRFLISTSTVGTPPKIPPLPMPTPISRDVHLLI